MRNRQLQLLAFNVLFFAVVFLCISFSGADNPGEATAHYYDAQLNNLLRELKQFDQAIRNKQDKTSLTDHFYACRLAYKKAELFIDLLEPYKARVLNGPDLLRIDEESPSDPLIPHGLQTVEALLFTPAINTKKLAGEVALLTKNINALRTNPDRTYYFTNERIWEAMRLATHRIVSLGITGFDAPLSYHSLPEAKAVLQSLAAITTIYKKEKNDTLSAKGIQLIMKATQYLDHHNDFNSFDRMTFIREYINPISDWLYQYRKRYGYINYDERTPLNPGAASLFASDLFNLAFFSPNEKYQVTADRIALGRRLFYDPSLSGNGNRSCASCHQPEKAFTDGLAKPYDLSGNKPLTRNTPTLWNTALQTRQFFDSRTAKLENQLSAVVHNTDEMNGSLKNSIALLAQDASYRQQFNQAYPEANSITEYNIANAISSYVRSLLSLDSRFDRYIRKQTDSFTINEKAGFNLFMGKAKCGTCHYAPLFSGLTPPIYQETESESIGVTRTTDPRSGIDPDPGKKNYTRVALHDHFFKTPTLRNIALTAPYMHNGAFGTLEEVINFYNDGGGAGRGVKLDNQTLPAEKLHLTKKEISRIIAFLQTLTDTSGVTITHYHIN